MNTELLIKALENESNSNIIDTTSSNLKQQINNILQQLQIDKETLKSFNKSLKNYIYNESINDIKIGHSIKYIKIIDPAIIKLSKNYIICNIKVNNIGILITLKTYNNKYFTIYFHENLIFKKINQEEAILLKALNYINK